MGSLDDDPFAAKQNNKAGKMLKPRIRQAESCYSFMIYKLLLSGTT